ncbi:MAG: peptidoglycan recognition family protein [Niameybacter sp.]
MTVDKYSRPGTKLSRVKGVVIHYVGNPGSSAEGNRNYFEGLKYGSTGTYASAHYIIGQKGDVIKCIPTSEMAYHVGSKTYKAEAVKKLSDYPNDCTIGIECCHPDSTGEPTAPTYNSMVTLAKQLCEAFGLNPATDLYLHHDITGKDCHRYFVANPKAWENFKRDVAGHKIPAEHKGNVDQLVKAGIIGAPELWYDTSNIQPANIEALINKMAGYISK